jgi:hypothetical protein
MLQGGGGMSPDEMRIEIAKACGWKHVYFKAGYYIRNEIHVWEELPDYLNDLNAMHEAEKVLYEDETQWKKYKDSFYGIKEFDGHLHATAAQRAEAFLRALNLWKD